MFRLLTREMLKQAGNARYFILKQHTLQECRHYSNPCCTLLTFEQKTFRSGIDHVKTVSSSSKYQPSEAADENPQENGNSSIQENNDPVPRASAGKFQVFRDEDSCVIFDIQEERMRNLENDMQAELTDQEFEGISLERGVHGVIELEELVSILQREKADDIFVVSTPSELNYVDYIVIVSGRSVRHMKAMAEFIRRVFKKKRVDTDRIPRIEGADSKEWIALDLGNIALHLFSPKARKIYDLETLWTVGAEYDDLYNKPDDPLISLLEDYSALLKDLKPTEAQQ